MSYNLNAGAVNEAKGADIASAATTDIGAAGGNYVHITGTTTITAFGTIQAGTRRVVEFDGILILTHNATSLILPGAINITTAAGDIATFISEGSGNWRCTGFMRANSLPLIVGSAYNLPAVQSVTSGVQFAVLKHGLTALVDGASVTAPDFRASASDFQTLTLTQNIVLTMAGDTFVQRNRLVFVLFTGAASDFTITLPADGICVHGPGTSAVVTIGQSSGSTNMWLVAMGTGISNGTVYWGVFFANQTRVKNVALNGFLNEFQGATIASATTTDIGAATGNYIVVSGTTTITGLGTIQAGTRRIVEFSGALILTHNATSLILPGGANITTTAGDVAVFISEGSGNWRCAGYLFSGSLPLLRTGGTLSGRLLVPNIEETQSTLTYSATPVIDFTGDSIKLVTMTGDITSMTTSNRAAGRKVTVILDPNGTLRTLTAFNSSWRNFSGAALPTSLAVGKYFIFTLQCTDTAETGVLIAGQTQQ